MQDDSGGDAHIKELNDISDEDRWIITEILEVPKSGGNNLVNFKKANQHQLEEITNRVNKVIDKIPTRTITETSLMQQLYMLLKSLDLNRLHGSSARHCGRKGELKKISKGLGKKSTRWKQ